MRVNIVPKQGLLAEATAFSCTNHRVVNHNIVSEIAYWSETGALLGKQDALLSDADYDTWCGMGPDDPDDPYFTECHMRYQNCMPAPVPPPTPDEPEVEPAP
jgi:hypothetical protein